MHTRIVCVTGTVAVLFFSWSLRGQESAAQRHEMATNHLKQVVARISARCLSDIKTLEEWTKQRPELRRQLLEMLGLDPLPARSALKAQITGKLERDAYQIEKLVFQSLPGLYVTGDFYLPKAAGKPLPSI